jgi:hypothetical protein
MRGSARVETEALCARCDGAGDCDDASAALDWARANGCEVDLYAAAEDPRREAAHVVAWFEARGEAPPDVDALAGALADEAADL